MSDTTQEPTMEEILASIRRIISEDDAPAQDAGLPAPEPAAAAPAPVPEPVIEPEPEPEPVVAAAPEPDPIEDIIEHEEEEEVLELTQRVAEPETHGDIDVYSPVPEPAPRAPEPAMAAAPVAAAAAAAAPSLVSASTQSVVSSAFGQLSAAIAMPRDGRTLEDVVRELLNPLLAAWLDEHLPAIVQAKVEEEVERMTRGRVR